MSAPANSPPPTPSTSQETISPLLESFPSLPEEAPAALVTREQNVADKRAVHQLVSTTRRLSLHRSVSLGSSSARKPRARVNGMTDEMRADALARGSELVFFEPLDEQDDLALAPVETAKSRRRAGSQWFACASGCEAIVFVPGTTCRACT